MMEGQLPEYLDKNVTKLSTTRMSERLLLFTFSFLLLIIPFQTNAQLSDLRGYGNETLAAFKTSSISPSPFLTGRSGAMGGLQFTVKDSTRDMFSNPAKYYGNQGIFISPSVTNKNILKEKEFGDSGARHNQTTKFTMYAVPVGTVFQTGSIYSGGFVGITNYNRNEQNIHINTEGDISSSNSIKEDISGVPIHLLSGYSFSENFSIAVSYQRHNLARSEALQNWTNQTFTRRSISHVMDFGKLGLSSTILGGKTYFLSGLFNSRYEFDVSDSVGNYWSEMNGSIFQIEHLHPVSKTLSVGGMIHFENRNFKDRTAETLYNEHNDQLTTIQFGTGMHRNTSSSEMGIEFIYQPVQYEFYNDQSFQNPDGYTTLDQKIDVKHFILRGGLDKRITTSFRLQAGISQALSSYRELFEEMFRSIPSENISQRNFRNVVLNSWNRTQFTTGLSYSFQRFDINYYVEIFLDGQDANEPRYRNQLSLQYLL